MQFSFNIPLPFFPLGDMKFSFKVYTKNAVYIPAKDSISVEKNDDGTLSIQKATLIPIDGTSPARGSLSATINHRGNDYSIRAFAEHSESVRAISLIIANIQGDSITTLESVKEMPLTLTPFKELVLTYPRIIVPLAFLHYSPAPDMNTYFRFEDTSFSIKRFIFRKDEYGTTLAEMLYEVPATKMKTSIESAAFNVGKTKKPDKIVKLESSFLKYKCNLKENFEKKYKPRWADKIGLIARFHFAHPSGKIFLDFESAKHAIDFLAKRIEKRRCLIKLSGWDGPYLKSLPALSPHVSLGGTNGFKALIEYAHSKKIFVGIEANIRYGEENILKEHGLERAEVCDIYGKPIPAPEIDFLGIGDIRTTLKTVTLTDERYFSHVKQRLEEIIKYGADGVFFSGTGVFENEADGIFYEHFAALMGALKTDEKGAVRKSLFFAADHYVDYISNYLSFCETANIINGFEIPTPTINRIYEKFFYAYAHYTYHAKTAGERGLLGVEPNGFRKPLRHEYDKKIIPLLNVFESKLDNNTAARRALEEAARRITMIS